MVNIKGEFINFLKNEKMLSSNTIESYTRDLNQFYDFIDGFGLDFKNVRKSTILNYLYFLKRNNKSQATISRQLSSLKSFYQFLFLNKITNEDPTYNIDKPKIEKKLPETLSFDQINSLLSLEYGNDEKGLRDKALIELLYSTGMRVSEIIELKIQDINLNYGFVICKAGKERVLPIGRFAVEALKNYIEKVRINAKKDDILFLNLKGKKLTRQGCWKIIKEYTLKINPGFTITPNTLRQTFAQHMIENGGYAFCTRIAWISNRIQ